MTSARTTLLTTAALLEQGSRLDRVSRPLTVAASIGVVLAPAVLERPLFPFAAVLAIALAGLAQLYFAIRVSLDATLFRQVARAGDAPDFDALDQSLIVLGVLQAGKRGRSVEIRVTGALRLLRLQALALIVQVLLLAAAGMAMVSVA